MNKFVYFIRELIPISLAIATIHTYNTILRAFKYRFVFQRKQIVNLEIQVKKKPLSVIQIRA